MKTRRSYPTVCHPGRPHSALGLCGACRQYLNKATATGHADERSEKLRQIVARHDERKTVAAAAARKVVVERKRRDPDRYRKGRDKCLRDRYGMPLAEYEARLADQGGACALCSRVPGTMPLHVDHRHDTGFVRGILCSRCNTAVAALDYLSRMDEARRERFHTYVAQGLEQNGKAKP